MPEMSFRIRWPDLSETDNYSPSVVIRDYFAEGEDMAVRDFLTRARAALIVASDRVKAKYGFPCSRAGATLAALERRAAPFIARDDARITLLRFSP